ncbi:DUF4190 domain-containing protein [Agromyces seonyuensis]|uniref:DUF4190 domain-containing protein n=1 Tax=Agromyces seonyuensis TaxID=2662446 RepID=UPI00192138AC|nr:DUF4190 domain-containing protein [Agromyces seonyuensis]
MTTVSPNATADTYGTAPRTAAGDEPRGFSVSSLVLGLVSIVAGFTFIVPIAGLVTGILGLKREPAGRTMAIWGIVLNSVMLAGVILFGLAVAALGLLALPFAFIG